MAAENNLLIRLLYSAVRMDHCIVVTFLSRDSSQQYFMDVAMYNLSTEQWVKIKVADGPERPSPRVSASAVAIGRCVYCFGGSTIPNWRTFSNELWKLWRQSERCFAWSKVTPECKLKTPSPRSRCSGWQYEDKLWIFGGYGDSTSGYLHDHGDQNPYKDYDRMMHNQLLCFDPSTVKWTNPQCFEAIPSPRFDHATASIKDTVWLFGGKSQDQVPTLYQLEMSSLVWTKIQSGIAAGPKWRRVGGSLTPADTQLVLYGGLTLDEAENERLPDEDTWIFDVTSMSWSLYTATKERPRWLHAGIAHDNNVFIIGGLQFSESGRGQCCEPLIYRVTLAARSLQQLAMKVVYDYRYVLPLDSIPKELKEELMLPDDKEQ